MSQACRGINKKIVLLVCGLWLFSPPVWALDVVVSIKPLHALTAAVMGDTGTPRLLMQGVSSPHTYTLRPSDARMLAKADLIFWGGVGLETFLARPLENLANKAHKVALLNLPDLTLLPIRKGGAWEEENHDAKLQHDHKQQHDHGQMDPHVWLDPQNAKIMGFAIAQALTQADAGNGLRYQTNAATLANRLDGLDEQLKQELASVRERPYIVFHDAYHYFEHRYKLGTVGSVVVHPDRTPGMRRIQEISEKMRATGAVCLFTEPQFPHRLAETVAQSGHVRIGTLDPLGATLPEGSQHYFNLMQALARSLIDCLKP